MLWLSYCRRNVLLGNRGTSPNRSLHEIPSRADKHHQEHSGAQRCENLGSRVALLPGIFLVRPEIFWAYYRNPDKLSGFFQIISHYPDGFKTIQMFPDHFPFSRKRHNCPDFSTSFPIFRTVSQLSRFFQIISKGWLAIAKLKPLSLFIPLF